MNIAYGFWAQIADWPMTARAALIIGFAFIVGFIILQLLYPRIFCVPFKLLDTLWKGVYWILAGFLRRRWSGDKYFQGAEKLNKISEIGEAFSLKLCKVQEKISKHRKVSFWRMLFLYGVLILLIGLPDMLQDKVSDEYLHYFSAVSNWYGNWEMRHLKAAEGHAPLFKKSQTIAAETTEASDWEEEAETASESPVLLTLSKKGWNGANIREDASAKSGIIVSISGDIQLAYVEKRDGWVHVVLPDGVEGWIKDSLVDGVPGK